VSVTIAGDFMSTESFDRQLRLAAGARRLDIADTEALPADFRHFHIALTIGGFTASRLFGVAIAPAARQGKAPASLPDRIAEALDEVSEHAEADTVRALARLSSGRAGAETDRMIVDMLPAIEDCHDCADFILVPLLWCRGVYGSDIAQDV